MAIYLPPDKIDYYILFSIIFGIFRRYN